MSVRCRDERSATTYRKQECHTILCVGKLRCGHSDSTPALVIGAERTKLNVVGSADNNSCLVVGNVKARLTVNKVRKRAMTTWGLCTHWLEDSRIGRETLNGVAVTTGFELAQVNYGQRRQLTRTGWQNLRIERIVQKNEEQRHCCCMMRDTQHLGTSWSSW